MKKVSGKQRQRRRPTPQEQVCAPKTPTRRPATIQDCAEGHGNNFHAIRLLMASLVLLSHCYPLTAGRESPEAFNQILGFLSFGAVGVNVFMAVSGFLITQSLLRRNNVGSFCKSRILRVVPALLVANLATALVLGSIETKLPLHHYLESAHWPWYVIRNTLLLTLKDDLPGVFLLNPVKYVVNGSLWTLPTEVRLYGVLAVLGLLRVHKSRWGSSALAAGALAVLFLSPAASEAVSNYLTPSLCTYFLCGMLLYLNQDRIWLTGWMAAGAAVLLGVCGRLLGGENPGVVVALSYLAIWFAYSPRLSALNGFARWGDYSYGMYIYAYPVQQTLVAHLPGISAELLLVLAYPAAAVLAFASWHLVEKKALRLKDVPVASLFRSRRQQDAPEPASLLRS